MEMKASEVFDRWTILLMKSKYSAEAASELATYDSEIAGMICRRTAVTTIGTRVARCNSAGEVTVEASVLKHITPLKFEEIKKGIHAIAVLAQSNAKIWELEAAIRDEFKNDPANTDQKPTLEEIGRRALAIREHNTVRVTCKKDIDEIFGCVVDYKFNHASES